MAVAEIHATLPQKTDLTIPIQKHTFPQTKAGRWDCYGLPSRWKQYEAIIVNFNHHACGEEVVQGFVGFMVVNV